MQKYADLMMCIIKNEVCGGECELDLCALTEDDIKALYAISNAHDLSHLLSPALSRSMAGAGTETLKKFEKQQMMAIFRTESLVYELEQVTSALEEAKIEHILLKGAVLRRYYPESWMRTSCDIDILVREKELETAERVMTEKLGYSKGVKNLHDVSFYAPSGAHIEIHYDLVEDGGAKNASKVLRTAWEHTVSVDKMNYCREMNDAMFYLYHIAHIAKHFRAGGIGAKGFLDLWILDHVVEHDEKARRELLDAAELYEFCGNARRLSEYWFGAGELDDKTRRLRDYILDNGAYGKLENRVSVSHGDNANGKLDVLRRRIFVPYDILKLRYPIIIKHRWLTPVMQIRRLGKIAFGGRLGRSVMELAMNVSVSKEKIEESRDFLSDMGL